MGWLKRLTQLKWLRPGMGVKRWVLLLVGGLTLIALGVATLPEVIDFSAWQAWLRRFQSPVYSRELQVVALLVGGSALIAVAVYGLSRSLVGAFRRADQSDIADVVYRHRQRQRGPKVVAIGGGHGLNSLLRGLKAHTDHITAIVTVADDGGSSGRLRRGMGMLPPGDFRNCIAALSDAEGLVAQLFQYRFGEDTDLEGHSFGNLYLTAMTAITGSFEGALAESSRVLAVRGRVIPSTLAQVTLCAEISKDGSGEGEGWQRVTGESSITAAQGRVQRVYLEPETPAAYPEAIKAILEADLIVAGPGSLYTSVLPNLLVPELAQAVAAAETPKVYVCNVATQAGETTDYDVDAHVAALDRHVGAGLFGIVVANDTFAGNPPPGEGVGWVCLPAQGAKGYRLVTADLVDRQYPWRHDPGKLAQTLMELIET